MTGTEWYCILHCFTQINTPSSESSPGPLLHHRPLKYDYEEMTKSQLQVQQIIPHCTGVSVGITYQGIYMVKVILTEILGVNIHVGVLSMIFRCAIISCFQAVSK